MAGKKQYRDRGTDTPDAPTTVVRIDSAAQAAKVEAAATVDVFELDGTTYSMPRVERADVALRYLEISNDEGEDAAAHYLITETLGADALAALAGVVGLESKQFDAVMKTVRRIALPKDRGRG